MPDEEYVHLQFVDASGYGMKEKYFDNPTEFKEWLDKQNDVMVVTVERSSSLL